MLYHLSFAARLCSVQATGSWSVEVFLKSSHVEPVKILILLLSLHNIIEWNCFPVSCDNHLDVPNTHTHTVFWCWSNHLSHEQLSPRGSNCPATDSNVKKAFVLNLDFLLSEGDLNCHKQFSLSQLKCWNFLFELLLGFFIYFSWGKRSVVISARYGISPATCSGASCYLYCDLYLSFWSSGLGWIAVNVAYCGCGWRGRRTGLTSSIVSPTTRHPFETQWYKDDPANHGR